MDSKDKIVSLQKKFSQHRERNQRERDTEYPRRDVAGKVTAVSVKRFSR